MTALLAGIDLSTKRLDAALIPLDPDHGDPHIPPVVFRHVDLPKTTNDGERYRAIRHAVRELCADHMTDPGVRWPGSRPLHIEITMAWVEAPRGPHAVRQLNGVYGAVMASIPTHIAACSIEPLEWRRELGLPRNLKKPAAIREAQFWVAMRYGIEPIPSITEHAAEALLVALAGRQINTRAWAA